MCATADMLYERQFRPAEAPDGADIPCAFVQGQVSFADHGILRPADFQRLVRYLRSGFIREIEFPHPAHASRGEALFVRSLRAQIARRGNSRAFLRSLGNQPSQLPIQGHLRQGGCKRGVDTLIQFAVIDIPFGVHRLLLSGATRLLFDAGQRKMRRVGALSFVLPIFQSCFPQIPRRYGFYQPHTVHRAVERDPRPCHLAAQHLINDGSPMSAADLSRCLHIAGQMYIQPCPREKSLCVD